MGNYIVGHGDPLAMWTLGHGGFALLASLRHLARAVRFPGEEMADPDSSRSDVHNLVVRNLDVGATNAHLNAVVADVFDAPAGEGASFGVFEQKRAGHFDSVLKR